jgi:biotin carboxyl carrier protein
MRLRSVLLVSLSASTLAAAAFFTRTTWRPWLSRQSPTPPPAEKAEQGKDFLAVSPQAQASLGLDVRPLKLTTAWRTLELPGEVVELPGHSDRIITSPVAGVVRRVYHAPWQTLRPGEKLFSLGLVSEFLQNSQTALFKAQRDLEIIQKLKANLVSSEREGGVPAARLLEAERQERSLLAAIQAHRFELAARGLRPAEIDGVTKGKFLSEVAINAPRKPADAAYPGEVPDVYEVQELKVGVGEQVRAGQVLCLLTDHQRLAIEGHGFKSEVPVLEKTAREGTPLRVEWLEGGRSGWPPHPETFRIRTLANVVDARSQTVSFYVPLANQYREYQRDGKTYRTWRYRPGQRVRLSVPVEAFPGVFELPRAAVARDGVEHYVFRQNGDVFERKPVLVLFETHRSVVVAKDGSIDEGHHIAHAGAAALNRALKTRSEEAEGGEGGHDHHHHHHH